MKWMKENSVVKRKAEKMGEEEIEGKIIVGDFADRPRPEFTESLCELVNQQYMEGTPASVRSAYKTKL